LYIEKENEKSQYGLEHFKWFKGELKQNLGQAEEKWIV
jgi:hypothetical protein